MHLNLKTCDLSLKHTIYDVANHLRVNIVDFDPIFYWTQLGYYYYVSPFKIMQ